MSDLIGDFPDFRLVLRAVEYVLASHTTCRCTAPYNNTTGVTLVPSRVHVLYTVQILIDLKGSFALKVIATQL